MCGSPISEFDGPDPIDLLWRISRRPGAEHPGLPQDEFPHAGGLARAVMQAVARHLWARSLLARGEHAPARAAGLSSIASWDDVTTEIALADPQMVARAHAFHAQLASRHSAAYRNFARGQLLGLARSARLKTESVVAAVAAADGDPHAAAVLLDDISRAWRAGLPVRLPGLRAIEVVAAAWYAASGDDTRAQDLAARAATVSGVLCAYPEDAPARWPDRLSQGNLLRFAFAATRLPDAMESGPHFPKDSQ